MNHFTYENRAAFLTQLSDFRRAYAEECLLGYGVFLREDGTIFKSDTHPKNLGKKQKNGVVAVCHPKNGWCG